MTLPVSVDSNITGLAYAEETSLKLLPGETAPGVGTSTATWYGLEPNSYADFGASFTSVAREIIQNTRQRLKGTITDETAKMGVNVDLTQRNLTRLLQGFFFADAFEKPATQDLSGTVTPVVITGITTGPNTFTAASGLDVFKTNDIIAAHGCGVDSNNGAALVTTGNVAGTVTVSKTLTAEATPPATTLLQRVGHRGASGDLTIAVAGALVTLGSTVLDFTTLNLHVGEWVFVGGDAANTAFATAGVFYARIYSIAAHALVFDLTSGTPVNDSGAGKTVEIYFGVMLANSADPTLIKRRSYNLERSLGNDGTGIQAEYVLGAVPDQLTLNLAQAAKAVCDITFVGLDIEENDGSVGLKAGTRVGLPGEAPYNTSQDVYLSRIAPVDPTTLNPIPLYAYASDIKLVINNGVKPNKALGVLGGFSVSVGDFVVNGTATAYFQSVAAVEKIKANADICLQTILAHQNSGMVWDIPLLTLGGGGSKVEKDKPIMIDLTQDGVKSNHQGYTLSLTVFDYLPTVAMP